MPNILKSQLEYIAVAPGATATLPTTLSLSGVDYPPDIISFDNPDFDYSSHTTTTLTVINKGAVVASCRVLCEHWHTIERSFGSNSTLNLPNRPFVNRGVDGGRVLTLGNFATFDPRIDGLAAAPGAIWAALDCPISMVKVGNANTDWTIDGRGVRPAILATMTADEMNALCRGFARQPALDFAPIHILTPDEANDRFTDTVSGDHLIKYGVGALIEPSPFFDASSAYGREGRQAHNEQSYFAAADATPYNVGNRSFVIMTIASFLKNATGALYVSKIKYPAPGQNLGYGVSINGDNGYGFLIRGSILELNNDTVQYSANVVDGRPRAFFHGRTVLGAGLGYVYTPQFSSVSVVGLAGDADNTDGIFGLLDDGFGNPRRATSTSRTYKLAFWDGTAADNLTTYLPAIAQGFQDMLGDAPFELQRQTQQFDLPVTDAEFTSRTGIAGAWYRPDWTNAAGNVISRSSVAGTLVASGATTQYQKLVSGEAGMGFPAAVLDVLSANIFPDGVDSFIAGGRFGHVANAGALNNHNLIGRLGPAPAVVGWSLFVSDAGDLKYFFNDGALVYTGTVAVAILPLDGEPLDAVIQLSRFSADPTVYIWWGRRGVTLGTATVVMAGLGNLTAAGQEFGCGAIPTGLPVTNGGVWTRFLFKVNALQYAGDLTTLMARGVGFLAFDVSSAQSLIG